jgi:hypothetical protein
MQQPQQYGGQAPMMGAPMMGQSQPMMGQPQPMMGQPQPMMVQPQPMMGQPQYGQPMMMAQPGIQMQSMGMAQQTPMYQPQQQQMGMMQPPPQQNNVPVAAAVDPRLAAFESTNIVVKSSPARKKYGCIPGYICAIVILLIGVGLMMASSSAAEEAEAMKPATDFVEHTCAVSSITGSREFGQTQTDCRVRTSNCYGSDSECCEEWNYQDQCFDTYFFSFYDSDLALGGSDTAIYESYGRRDQYGVDVPCPDLTTEYVSPNVGDEDMCWVSEIFQPFDRALNLN